MSRKGKNMLSSLSNDKDEQLNNLMDKSEVYQESDKILDVSNAVHQVSEQQQFNSGLLQQMQSTPKASYKNLSKNIKEIDQFMFMQKMLLRKMESIERLAKNGLKKAPRRLLQEMESDSICL